jgi:Domian of unknown function (DUF4952)
MHQRPWRYLRAGRTAAWHDRTAVRGRSDGTELAMPPTHFVAFRALRPLLLAAFASITFVGVARGESSCDDVLGALHKKPKDLEFQGCEQHIDRQGIFEARYRVAGIHAAEVESYLARIEGQEIAAALLFVGIDRSPYEPSKNGARYPQVSGRLWQSDAIRPHRTEKTSYECRPSTTSPQANSRRSHARQSCGPPRLLCCHQLPQGKEHRPLTSASAQPSSP